MGKVVSFSRLLYNGERGLHPPHRNGNAIVRGLLLKNLFVPTTRRIPIKDQ